MPEKFDVELRRSDDRLLGQIIEALKNNDEDLREAKATSEFLEKRINDLEKAEKFKSGVRHTISFIAGGVVTKIVESFLGYLK